MELKEITVTASVSKNYQKGEFTATATVESLQDIEDLKELCKKNAIDILNSITDPADKAAEEFEEQPVRRQIISQPAPQAPIHSAAIRAKKRPGDCKIGETYSFTGVIYKLCHSDAKNDTYWKIQDESQIDKDHPKYRKDGLNQQ